MPSETYDEITHPVWPLDELYAELGSKDSVAQKAVSQLVEGLVEFGVSPFDISHHLSEAAQQVKKEQ
jgi:hypothetical protein